MGIAAALPRDVETLQMGQNRVQIVSPVQIGDGDIVECALHQALQNLASADLDKGGHTGGLCREQGLAPTHASGHLGHQIGTQGVRVTLRRR